MYEIIFDYLNGFKNADRLINRLEKLDLTGLSAKEKKELQQLIVDIKANIENEDELIILLDNFPPYEKWNEELTVNDLTLLLTKDISVPEELEIEQELFDQMVDEAIKMDNSEIAWRLAFNFDDTGKDLTKIENFFIDKRDSDYMCELISSSSSDIKMDELIARIMKTNDKAFIQDIINRCTKMGVLDKKYISLLSESIK